MESRNPSWRTRARASATPDANKPSACSRSPVISKSLISVCFAVPRRSKKLGCPLKRSIIASSTGDGPTDMKTEFLAGSLKILSKNEDAQNAPSQQNAKGPAVSHGRHANAIGMWQVARRVRSKYSRVLKLQMTSRLHVQVQQFLIVETCTRSRLPPRASRHPGVVPSSRANSPTISAVVQSIPQDLRFAFSKIRLTPEKYHPCIVFCCAQITAQL